MDKQIVPIFYACDKNFVKYTVVSLYSMIKNASKDYDYRVYILHTSISEDIKKKVLELENDSFKISFEDVTEHLDAIAEKLPIRDYYSKTTYYRLFIAEMFPEYDKAIYIDSDTVVQGDISELYMTDIKDAYVGACHEQAMVQVDEYGTYAEKVVGVSRHNFFNAGMILINCHQFRMHFVLDKFIEYLHAYTFVVTQDEDYLNLICKDHVFWLDQRWNTEIFGEIAYPIEEAKILHYIMVSKPWHYADCRHGEIFWKYAEETCFCGELRDILNNYSDAERKRDAESMDNLLKLAVSETNKEDNYLNLVNKNKRSRDRVEILRKIEQLEREGRFDEDVEEDPPSRVLMPEEIDYYRRGAYDKLKTKLAFMIARRFVNTLIEEKKLIIKEIKGIEHLNAIESGAIITCNHFNAFDSFAIQMAYEASEHADKKFYRVIREGNYTSFPGFYGFLMRHCNTLPLSSNRHTVKKLIDAIDTLLSEGHFVLVYPEQSMWWNYRKPKPLKSGAFRFAAKNGVPVVPCFITMKDSDIMGEDGFFVQEYTINISEPIYPDTSLPYRKSADIMMQKNYDEWKSVYEEEYQIPLEYITENIS
ncbi:MAG: 1-acyl-sn-glycerol-3-phosphate acyltransferase [Clostridia bacterium]|nr:1-acyl-sn-glycerol-3-phosphate acyltransferase [Clostridia bacterium]